MDVFKTISLEKNSSTHLYIQLFDAIKQMILDEKIKPNEKLPPIRQLAALLEINTSTVVNCYSLLESEGLIFKKIGSGSFVRPLNKGVEDSVLNKYPIDEDFKMMDRGQLKIKENVISFSSATPTSDLFPVEDFKILLNQVLDRDKGDAFGYQESQGYYPLRDSLVEYLKNYGISTRPENIQIISGAQQGIDVISKAFINYKDTVLLESPSYTGAIASFKNRGANIVTAPIYENGIDLKKLEENIVNHRPKLVYLMPNFQNPTGYTYDMAIKKKIVELARTYNILIVEDDYLSDLSFYNSDNTTLKSLDQSDAVVYIKSFSKIFMPGLRLGFLVIPQKITNQILAAKHTSDISTSGLNQRVFDLYLRKGIWRKHIQYMESIYKERFDMMKNCLEKYLAPLGVTYVLPKGGLNFWLKLPNNLSSNDLYIEAQKNNVLILPGSIFYINDKTISSWFRISIASVYPENIEKGMALLAETIERFIIKENSRISNNFTPLL